MSQGSKKILKFQNNSTQNIVGKDEETFGYLEAQKIVAFFYFGNIWQDFNNKKYRNSLYLNILLHWRGINTPGPNVIKLFTA